MYQTITECIDQCGLQLADEPRSKLSRTGHNWATNDTHVDIPNGMYPRADAAGMWMNAGFLDPTYLDPGYSQTYLDADTDNLFSMWVTCRRLYELPEV
jgi:hypothetical protein